MDKKKFLKRWGGGALKLEVNQVRLNGLLAVLVF